MASKPGIPSPAQNSSSATGFSVNPSNTTNKNGDVISATKPLNEDEFKDASQGEAATYMTADAVRFYKPIPSYEGYHRWDPYFEWEEKEEKRLVRKVCF